MIKVNKKIILSIMAALSMSMNFTQTSYAVNRTDDYVAIIGGHGYAQDSRGVTWTYSELNNGTIDILGTETIDPYMEVPQTLNGKTVSVITAVALPSYEGGNRGGNPNSPKVTKVKLPSTVKIIEDRAFMNFTNLKEVEMPENADRSEYLFSACPTVKINGKTNKIEYTDNLSAGWNDVGDHRYFIDSNGNKYTGWLDQGDKRYYFYGNGQMATEFLKLGEEAYYYLDPNRGSNYGNVVTGWKSINGKWYFFNYSSALGKEKGYMQTGWFNNHGNWYYFYSDGTMATGFINLGGDAYYYLDESNSSSQGVMQTGWKYINKKWYYFNTSFDSGILGMMKKGWQYIGGNWYYFYPKDGTMAANTYIDGYYVNKSGAWVK